MKGKLQPKGKRITVEDRRFVDRRGVPQRKFKVNPPVASLRPGDTVTIAYEGGKGGVVMIPVAGVFTHQVYALPAGRDSRVEMKVLANAPRGSFSYGILCHDLDEFAEGASPPKMAITESKKGGD